MLPKILQQISHHNSWWRKNILQLSVQQTEEQIKAGGSYVSWHFNCKSQQYWNTSDTFNKSLIKSWQLVATSISFSKCLLSPINFNGTEADRTAIISFCPSSIEVKQLPPGVWEDSEVSFGAEQKNKWSSEKKRVTRKGMWCRELARRRHVNKDRAGTQKTVNAGNGENVQFSTLLLLFRYSRQKLLLLTPDNFLILDFSDF